MPSVHFLNEDFDPVFSLGTRFAPTDLARLSVRTDARARCEAIAVELGRESDMLSEATVAYVLSVRPAFDLVRDAMGQLAGLMVLASVGSRRWRDRPLLELAAERIEEARNIVGATQPTPAGQHHYDHLVGCASILRNAQGCAERIMAKPDREAVTRTLELLHEAARHLQAASAALPGFNVVALDACCCGPRSPHMRGLRV